MSRVGIVVIGRNEGLRLGHCLASLRGYEPIVYVDSGSTDGSGELAEARGILTFHTPEDREPTAALAREIGWRALVGNFPDVEFVQFIDGDCLLAADWIEIAREFLIAEPEVAVAFGRRREWDRYASVWARLCDQEWRQLEGNAAACGGDALFRRRSLERVGGFRTELVSWEEPELCQRLRWDHERVVCLDHAMSVHLGAPRGPLGWWRRQVRAGRLLHVIDLHGTKSPAAWRHTARSNWFWGIVLPVGIGVAFFFDIRAMGLLLAFSWPALRAFLWRRKAFGEGLGESATYGLFCVVSKFAQASGQLLYFARTRLDFPIWRMRKVKLAA